MFADAMTVNISLDRGIVSRLMYITFDMFVCLQCNIRNTYYIGLACDKCVVGNTKCTENRIIIYRN